jgi:protein TilB
MDSSLIDLDIQPNYVRVILKGKALQLALSEEVKPDSSTAQRSQTTGNLVIKMPKLNVDQDKLAKKKSNEINTNISNRNKESKKSEKTSNYLEVDPTLNSKRIDLSQIVQDSDMKSTKSGLMPTKRAVKERDNSPSFVDCEDVPPLM